MKRKADAVARHRVPRNISLWKMSAIAAALGLVCVAVLQALGGTEEAAKANNASESVTSAGSAEAPQDAACDALVPVRAVIALPVVDLAQTAATQACVELDVVAAAGREGVRASEAADVDLWISDSSMWAHARRVPLKAKPTSIASSPIVAVAAPAMADQVSKQGVFSWQTIAGLPEGATVGFQDPIATATGLLTAWPVLTTLRSYDPERLHGLALSANALAGTTALSDAQLKAPPAGTVGFAAEYAVQRSDLAEVMRGKEGEPFLDFPAYVQTTDAATSAGVDRMMALLTSAELDEERAAARLRNADGKARFDTTEVGTAGPRIAPPSRKDAIRIFGLSASGSAVGRNLVAIDVSGSMATVLPNGKTLFDTVRDTSLLAMTTLLDHTHVGLWAFGSEIKGRKDYREIVSIRPLGENRKQLIGALRAMQPIPDSGTGLYDTVLAGYQALQRDFDPQAVTTLIVMTDGKNDEARGLNLVQLKRELRRIQDPTKPIELAGIGFGQADVRSLEQVADVIGGRVTKVRDPMQLLGIMITMIGETAATA
jgi:Ca-activated chloride channel homolog